MRALLRRIFAPDLGDLTNRLETLSARLATLERDEQERERATSEQLDQLRRYWKRLQTRNGREPPESDDTHQLLLRSKFGGR